MNELLKKKAILDAKIKELTEEFSIENKCGYSANVKSGLVYEDFDDGTRIYVGMNSEVNSVITN